MEFTALQQCGALDFFSEYGKEIFNPTGIFYWSGRAKTEASINATIGAAVGKASHVLDGAGDETITLCIPAIKDYFPNLSTEDVFPYAPEVGLPTFRDAWKAWLLRKAGDRAAALEPTLLSPMVVSGITGAISVCTRMFVNPGTPVIVPEKRWENYDNIFFRNVGCTVREFNSFADGEFNTAGFIEAIQDVWTTQDCAVAMVNFPNNPTGYCPLKTTASAFVDAIHALVKSTDKKLVLLFDDAYEGYVYDSDAEARSLFYFCEPRDNFLPVKLDGVSKEMLWYGARIGAITLNVPPSWLEAASRDDVVKEVENKFRGVVRNTVSNSSRVAQSAALKALQDLDTILTDRRKTVNVLTQRYAVMKTEIANVPADAVSVDPFQGGFFCFVNLLPATGLKASAVCDHLLTKYQVGLVPIESGDINGIRIAFCSVEAEDIPRLCESLGKAIEDLR